MNRRDCGEHPITTLALAPLRAYAGIARIWLEMWGLDGYDRGYVDGSDRDSWCDSCRSSPCSCGNQHGLDEIHIEGAAGEKITKRIRVRNRYFRAAKMTLEPSVLKDRNGTEIEAEVEFSQHQIEVPARGIRYVEVTVTVPSEIADGEWACGTIDAHARHDCTGLVVRRRDPPEESKRKTEAKTPSNKKAGAGKKGGRKRRAAAKQG